MMFERELSLRSANPIGLRDIGRVLAGSWRRIVSFAAVCGAVAALVVQSLPRTYTASTLVMYDPALTINFSQNQRSQEPGVEMNMRIESQVEVITSATVAERVIDKLGLVDDPEFATKSVPHAQAADSGPADESPAARAAHQYPEDAQPEAKKAHRKLEAIVPAFLSRLSKRRVGRSTVMEIRFNCRDAEKAVRINNAVANAYIEFDLDQKSEALRRGSDWLQSRLQELRKQSFEALSEVERFKRSGQGTVNEASVRLAELESTAQTFRRLYEGVHQQLMETQQRISYPVADARVLSFASVSRVTSEPKSTLIIVFATALGGALGAILSMVHVSQNGRVRTSEDLARTGLPLLGRVVHRRRQRQVKKLWERIKTGRRGFKPRRTGPRALRELAELHIDVGRPFRAVATSGPLSIGICGLAGPHAATVAGVLLARQYAALGRRVLLVDANLDEQATSGLLAPASERGLCDALLAHDDAVAGFVVRHALGFDVMPVGSEAARSELAHHPATAEQFAALLVGVHAIYDLCLIDIAYADRGSLRGLEPHLAGTAFVVEGNTLGVAEVERRIAGFGAEASAIFGVFITDATLPELKQARSTAPSPDMRQRVGASPED